MPPQVLSIPKIHFIHKENKYNTTASSNYPGSASSFISGTSLFSLDILGISHPISLHKENGRVEQRIMETKINL